MNSSAVTFQNRHQSTLRIVLRRKLADCTPCREIPVLCIQRPLLLGGDFEIDLDNDIYPVRMLPVSGNNVRNLRFGLVHGPKRKRVRFRARDLATYEKWKTVLEAAVEKAATKRSMVATWLDTVPILSAPEDSYISDEFGYSDGDESCKAVPLETKLDSGSTPVDLLHLKKPLNDDDDTEEEYERDCSTESDEEASILPLAREFEVTRPMVPFNGTYQSIGRTHDHEIDWKSHLKPLSTTHAMGPEVAKLAIGDSFSWT
ncbi:hypothetical protein CCR75_004189 [Bremia lactucae]|uniref:PH domain-containing protein n=1 Tax=Bremia lactucae TaxID=4779 RepID=A0A976IDX0_BRELC|nr:hypothetical protein CCR75_004189 [Bremia lactucae]